MRIFRISSSYENGDEVQILHDIYDFDTGKLRVKRNSKAKVVREENNEYVRVRFPNNKTFSVFKPLIESEKEYSHDFSPDDKVVTSKDVMDMVRDRVLIERGTEGVVVDTKGRDFIRVHFENRDRPQGVHVSEINAV